jgi:hypothetical protein
MFSAGVRPSLRRTFLLVIAFEVLVVAALWLVGRAYG